MRKYERTFLALCKEQLKWADYPMTKDMNLAELVARIQESGKKITQKLLETRLLEDPRANPANPVCPDCKNKLRIQEIAQRRVLNTALGEIPYERAYGVCDRCGYTGYPLDESLGIPRSGPSVDAREKICHATVVTRSFKDSSEILKVHSAMAITRKHVRTISESEGKRLVELRFKEVQQYQEHKLNIQSKEKPKLLVITADGGRVQTRQLCSQDRWKEDKIGVVYDAIPQARPHASDQQYPGARPQTKTFVATMESWESMGWMLRLEAEKRGYANGQEKLFLADGAPALRELKNFHFPEATFILDWYHSAEHLSDCSKALFGEGTIHAHRWYKLVKQWLWNGQLDRLIDKLQRHSKRLGKPKESDSGTSPKSILYRNAYSYFPNNKDAMNYPAYRAKGWPIGSGVAEGSVKQFGIRLKGSEKFWNVSNLGAEEMLALCALYHSEDGRWRHYWDARAKPYKKE